MALPLSTLKHMNACTRVLLLQLQANGIGLSWSHRRWLQLSYSYPGLLQPSLISDHGLLICNIQFTYSCPLIKEVTIKGWKTGSHSTRKPYPKACSTAVFISYQQSCSTSMISRLLPPCSYHIWCNYLTPRVPSKQCTVTQGHAQVSWALFYKDKVRQGPLWIDSASREKAHFLLAQEEVLLGESKDSPQLWNKCLDSRPLVHITESIFYGWRLPVLYK